MDIHPLLKLEWLSYATLWGQNGWWKQIFEVKHLNRSLFRPHPTLLPKLFLASHLLLIQSMLMSLDYLSQVPNLSCKNVWWLQSWGDSVQTRVNTFKMSSQSTLHKHPNVAEGFSGSCDPVVFLASSVAKFHTIFTLHYNPQWKIFAFGGWPFQLVSCKSIFKSYHATFLSLKFAYYFVLCSKWNPENLTL